jgi:hypothetical protein
MSAPPDIHTREEIEGDRRGGRALEHQREAATLALRDQARTDLADMSEEEFGRGLERLKLRQTRMRRILETALEPDVHFGNPKDRSGKGVFEKPILYQAGAQELRNLLGLTLVKLEPNTEVIQGDFVSVTVHMGIQDRVGRIAGVRDANCNTAEKRFQRYDGKGPIWKDAREKFHDCVAMAEKRAGNLLTLEASGATGFFSSDDVPDGEADEVITPWSAEEKKLCYETASGKGIGRKAFAELILKTLGRDQVGTGEDVRQVLAAIAAWIRPAKKDNAGKAEAPVAAAASEPGGREPEDEALDLSLAKD